jgi:branched-chain amino acid transport system substrate-binding protein
MPNTPLKNCATKIAVLAQNDDFGRDYLAGLRDVLESRFEQVVSVATYEVTEPTIDSQVVRLKASEADVFLIAATPKFAAQAIRKAHEIGWKPTRFLSNVSIWISSVMEVAGLDAGIGIISTAFAKDPMDPAWSGDGGVKDWREFMAKYAPGGDIRDQNYVFGYNFALALEHVLKAAGNDLSPENIHKQAYSIRDLELPMLLPGIKVNTAPDDHMPVKQMQFMRFDGKQWERFGEVLTTN